MWDILELLLFSEFILSFKRNKRREEKFYSWKRNNIPFFQKKENPIVLIPLLVSQGDRNYSLCLYWREVDNSSVKVASLFYIVKDLLLFGFLQGAPMSHLRDGIWQ